MGLAKLVFLGACKIGSPRSTPSLSGQHVSFNESVCSGTVI